MSTNLEKSVGAERPPFLVHAVGGASRWLSIMFILAIFASVIIEVTSRTFGQATIWATEVTTYLVLAVTFVGAAFVATRDAHVRVDLLLNLFSEDHGTTIKRALSWLAVFVCLVTLWKSAGFWAENYESSARSWSLLNTPLWIPQTAVLVGFSSLILVLAAQSALARRSLALVPIILALALVVLDGTGLFAIDQGVAWSLSGLGLLVLAAAFMSSGPSTLLVLAFVLAPVCALFTLSADSALIMKSTSLVGILLFLLLTGLPVVYALLAIGIFAIVFWLPPIALNFIGERTWEAVNAFEFAAIPMFVLMGALLVRSNASAEMFAAAGVGLGRIRGSLAHASILASGIFAAVSGSSLATAATMGRVAGPEMMREGYKPQLAYGVIAAGGTLGILIPPSIAMIIYGPLAGVPVTELFIAGIVPGILMIVAFTFVTLIWIGLDGAAAPHGKSATMVEKLVAMKGVLPFIALMVLVLGSMYAGIVTPTEAGAFGVLGAAIISALRGTLSWRAMIASFEEAASTTSLLLMIAVAAAVMGFAIDFLSMPQSLVQYVQSINLPNLWLFVAIVILYLVLGMFLEPISMVLMTLPIILPVVLAAGWDPLWFGIVLVMLVEIGMITPPVGMILYVLSGVSDERASLGQISVGALPFVGAFLAMVFAFYAIPSLVTFLPELMR